MRYQRLTTYSGTVANGTSINTATAGTKSFTVTAKDNAGNSAAETVSYSVEGSGGCLRTGHHSFDYRNAGIQRLVHQ